TFIADPSTVSVSTSTVARGTNNVTADGSATSTITITVKDANSNPLAGQTVSITSNGTNNTLTQPGSTTDVNGQTTATIASTTAEAKTITAHITPSYAISPLTPLPSVTFIADPSTVSVSTSTVVRGTNNVTADGSATSTITITVKDANSNPVSGQTISITSTG